MLRDTSIRAPGTQVCPVAMNAANNAPATASSISTSSNTSTGALPPNSAVIGINACPAAATMTRPVAVPPVTSSLAIPRCSASALPVLVQVPERNSARPMAPGVLEQHDEPTGHQRTQLAG